MFGEVIDVQGEKASVRLNINFQIFRIHESKLKVLNTSVLGARHPATKFLEQLRRHEQGLSVHGEGDSAEGEEMETDSSDAEPPAAR